MRIRQPVLELGIETGNHEIGDHPPAGLVTVVQPFDRGRKIDPDEYQRADALKEHQNEMSRRCFLALAKVRERGAQHRRIDDTENVIDTEMNRFNGATEQLLDDHDE